MTLYRLRSKAAPRLKGGRWTLHHCPPYRMSTLLCPPRVSVVSCAIYRHVCLFKCLFQFSRAWCRFTRSPGPADSATRPPWPEQAVRALSPCASSTRDSAARGRTGHVHKRALQLYTHAGAGSPLSNEETGCLPAQGWTGITTDTLPRLANAMCQHLGNTPSTTKYAGHLSEVRNAFKYLGLTLSNTTRKTTSYCPEKGEECSL